MMRLSPSVVYTISKSVGLRTGSGDRVFLAISACEFDAKGMVYSLSEC